MTNLRSESATKQQGPRQQGFFSRWMDFNEAPIPANELEPEIEANSVASFGFFVMLALSASLASLGLIANSAAVIIGAMIVAPLMNPIVAIGFSIVRGNTRLLLRSVVSVGVGVLLVIGIAYLTAKLAGSGLAGSEILARSNPNLLDLGVALCAGTAGAFAVTRRRIANAIPGVAISVALVPPLCVTGVGLAVRASGSIVEIGLLGLQEIAHVQGGSMILFVTNLSGIILVSTIVFLTQGYGKLRQAFWGLVATVVLMVLITFPLISSMEQILFRSRIIRGIRSLSQVNPQWAGTELIGLSLDQRSNPPQIVLEIASPADILSEKDVRIVKEGLKKSVGQEVEVEFKVIEYSTIAVGE